MKLGLWQFALASVLAACGTSTEITRAAIARTAPTHASPGGGHHDEPFEGWDGTRLYAQSWRPAGAPRAVLVVQHGLKDYGSCYAALAEMLITHSYAVHAMDLREHGR